MKIELLGFPDCPNTPQLRATLMAALDRYEGNWELHDIDQRELTQPDVRLAYPAPTILVNGSDLMGMSALQHFTLGCRIYPGGLPDAETILAKLNDSNRD